MKNKNKYYVVIMYSSHNNFDFAEASRDVLIQGGKDARIFYRGIEVTKNVKKVIKQNSEGI